MLFIRVACHILKYATNMHITFSAAVASAFSHKMRHFLVSSFIKCCKHVQLVVT